MSTMAYLLAYRGTHDFDDDKRLSMAIALLEHVVEVNQDIYVTM